jgi:hypothetical protein
MKIRILLLLAICFSNFVHSQNITFDEGEKFNFDFKQELDPKFVLVDNYNHYLFSVYNKDGMVSRNEIVIRKFDQKNHLVETYTQEFFKKDPATSKKDVYSLNNYLGSFEIPGNKVVIFTESYSGRGKIKEIFKHVFEKSTAKFTTTLIGSYPIEGLGKCGTTFVRKSENNNFIGINYLKNNTKKEPEVNIVIVLDSNLNTVWQKEVSLSQEFVTNSLTITNTGKAVLYRDSRNRKINNYMVLVSADKQEDKNFGEEIKIQLNEPKSIAIDNKDYLIAFNGPAKGGADIENLMLYDLEAGKIVKNDKIPEFNCVRGLSEVQYRNIAIQNNEIIIFEESKVKLEMKKDFTVGSMQSGYPADEFIFESATVFVMSFDGTIKKVKKINAGEGTKANINHIFGLVNRKGKFYLNVTNRDFKHTYGLNALDESYAFDENNSINFSNIVKEKDLGFSFYDVANQLVLFFPESNRFLITKLNNENQMSFMNIVGLNLK